MHKPHDSDESCPRGPHGHGEGRGHFGGHKIPPFVAAAMQAHGYGGPGGLRARRGDVRAAVLRLLSEKPMHGYQIIQELSARSDGAWTPSAGSIYPVLQLLADEGLITAEETAGKRVFSLSESGVAAVAETAGTPAPWEDAAESGSDRSALREAVGKFMPAIFQVGKNGSAEQVAAAVEILTEARKKLYAILAED